MWRNTTVRSVARCCSSGTNARQVVQAAPFSRKDGSFAAFSTLSSRLHGGLSAPTEFCHGFRAPLHSNQCSCCSPSLLQARKRVGEHQRDFRHSLSSSSKGDKNEEGILQAPSDEIKIPGAEKGGRKLAIIFTCTQCNTRSAKQFTERAYKYGVVIATCPGCSNRHLIADNLGFFSEEEGGWNIENAMARLGENVRVATTDNVLELSVEDIYTKEAIDEAITKATEKATNPDSSSNG